MPFLWQNLIENNNGPGIKIEMANKAEVFFFLILFNLQNLKNKIILFIFGVGFI